MYSGAKATRVLASPKAKNTRTADLNTGPRRRHFTWERDRDEVIREENRLYIREAVIREEKRFKRREAI